MVEELEGKMQELRHTLLHGNWEQVPGTHQAAYQAWAQQRQAAGQAAATPQQWYMAEVLMKGLGQMLLTGTAAPKQDAGAGSAFSAQHMQQHAATLEKAATVPVGEPGQRAPRRRARSAGPEGRSGKDRTRSPPLRDPIDSTAQAWEHQA